MKPQQRSGPQAVTPPRPKHRLLLVSGLGVVLLVGSIALWPGDDDDTDHDRTAREAWLHRQDPRPEEASPPGQISIDILIRDFAKKTMVLVDTRPAEAYAAGHIPKAFPQAQIQEALKAARTGPGALPIILYGAGPQDPGPAVLAETLRQQGRLTVLICPAGITGWSARHQDLAP